MQLVLFFTHFVIFVDSLLNFVRLLFRFWFFFSHSKQTRNTSCSRCVIWMKIRIFRLVFLFSAKSVKRGARVCFFSPVNFIFDFFFLFNVIPWNIRKTAKNKRNSNSIQNYKRDIKEDKLTLWCSSNKRKKERKRKKQWMTVNWPHFHFNQEKRQQPTNEMRIEKFFSVKQDEKKKNYLVELWALSSWTGIKNAKKWTTTNG